MEQPQHRLSKSLSLPPASAVPPPAALSQARVHCPPAQAPLHLPQLQEGCGRAVGINASWSVLEGTAPRGQEEVGGVRKGLREPVTPYS